MGGTFEQILRTLRQIARVQAALSRFQACLGVLRQFRGILSRKKKESARQTTETPEELTCHTAAGGLICWFINSFAGIGLDHRRWLREKHKHNTKNNRTAAKQTQKTILTCIGCSNQRLEHCTPSEEPFLRESVA